MDHPSGITLRALRKANRLDQTQAARILGTSQTQLSRWEAAGSRGRPPADRWEKAERRLALGSRAKGERARKYLLALAFEAHPWSGLQLNFLYDEEQRLGIFCGPHAPQLAQAASEALMTFGLPDVAVIPCWADYATDLVMDGGAQEYFDVDAPGSDEPVQEWFAVRARVLDWCASAMRRYVYEIEDRRAEATT